MKLNVLLLLLNIFVIAYFGRWRNEPEFSASLKMDEKKVPLRKRTWDKAFEVIKFTITDTRIVYDLRIGCPDENPCAVSCGSFKATVALTK